MEYLLFVTIFNLTTGNTLVSLTTERFSDFQSCAVAAQGWKMETERIMKEKRLDTSVIVVARCTPAGTGLPDGVVPRTNDQNTI
jgi:hypothetical protein